ncbi:MAG: NAD(P)/FAD-dependent oxidoreductase [Gracilibacteraceae bacterium]|jgi:2,4-dienoyl-CoA reductase (NADPH2)|nr:NAD(P)/FAD-dependent oxidoreductase [Gracilibacteraceae bacterium]
MTEQFPLLSAPLRLRNRVLKNRLMTTSMSPGRGYVDMDGTAQPRFIHYLEERARGQVALICQTVAMFPRRPDQQDHLYPLPIAFAESDLPNLRRMAEAVHRHSGLLAGQLYAVHDWKAAAEDREEHWGPSDVPVLKNSPPIRVMSQEDIAVFRRHMTRSALLLQEAGWDGAEVMAGVGGILNRFLSRATNKREDEYGGSLPNRVRLTTEVIRDLRAACGEDFIITVRWSPVEYILGGHEITDSLAVVPYLEEAGMDLHNLAVGWHESSVALTTKDVPDGHWAWIAAAIKSVARLPVAQGYRMTDPWVMEEILRQGKADVIAGLRYNIADPEFPRKIMENRPQEIKRCITCCRCIDDAVSAGRPLNFCGVNPRMGPELDESPPPAAAPRKVVVVGSGPAGLAAAVTALERGHQVTVYERGPRLGGCLLLSSVFSPTYELLLQYYKQYLAARPDIRLRLNTPFTLELPRLLEADAVIIAAGGIPIALGAPGAERDNVVQSHDFLSLLSGRAPRSSSPWRNFMWRSGAIFLRFCYTPALARKFMARVSWPLGRKLAVVGGGLPGCELTKEMMKHGREITLLEEGKRIGADVGGSDRFLMISAFRKAENVRLEASSRVTAVTETGVAVQKEDGTCFTVEADTVAVTLGFAANRQLAQRLRQAGVRAVYEAGDCLEPARIADATKAGYLAALKI